MKNEEFYREACILTFVYNASYLIFHFLILSSSRIV